MTQEQFTNLVATTAAGLAPVLLLPGHASAERLSELARVAADLAQRIAKEAQSRYRAADWSI